MLIKGLKELFLYLLIMMSVVTMAGIVVGMFQTRFFFSLKPIEPDLNKINPIAGFKRIFSARSLFEMMKSIVKICIVGIAGYSVIKKNWNNMLLLSDMEIIDSSIYVWNMIMDMFIKCGMAIFVLAFVDYVYSKFEYEKSLKMTKEEIKEEMKDIEGNPEIKRKQRQIMYQQATHRMMQDVPKADVVITNPTHFAVAIKYEPEKMFAPILLAKGADEIARKIKDIARENRVPIIRNPRLAREVYYSTNIGDEIPSKLYRAVAEVLAYVYSLKNKSLG